MTVLDDSVKTALAKCGPGLLIPGAQVSWLRAGEHLQWSYGTRDVQTGAAVDDATPFPIGSLTKPWVAAMAMILATDEGINLDDSLVEFFPGTAFSLRQLLSHTAGFPTRLEGPDGTPSEWAQVAVRPDALGRPGRWSSYSSAGIVTAAALVEQLSGLPWFESIRRFLAEPLGIDIYLARAKKHGAGGHHPRLGGGWTPVDAVVHPNVEDAAGGLAVSASGLIAFMEAGMSGTFPFDLPEEHRRALVTDQVSMQGLECSEANRWSAWSLQVRGDRNGGQLVLDCFLDGVVANLRCIPQTGEALTMLTNGDRGDRLWREMREVFDSAEVDEFTGVVVAPSLACIDPPRDALGEYFDGPDAMHIDLVEGVTVLRVNGFILARLDWHQGARFSLVHESRGVLGQGSFVRLADGEELLHLAGRVARRIR